VDVDRHAPRIRDDDFLGLPFGRTASRRLVMIIPRAGYEQKSKNKGCNPYRLRFPRAKLLGRT